MRYTLAIFDLDGTLADSFPWFLANVNVVADRFGFRRIAETDVEPLRRKGTREILKRLDVPRWKVPLIARHSRRLKAQHAHAIALFPGVGEMLQTLVAHGVRLALVSSDAEANARRLLGAHAAYFSDFACGVGLFGKAANFRRVLRRAQVEATEAISIGDEIRDIEAARKAGIDCGAVTWGYAAPEALKAHAPDLIFSSIEDIVRQLVPRRRVTE
jgi:phosphoglycolate phosphatase